MSDATTRHRSRASGQTQGKASAEALRRLRIKEAGYPYRPAPTIGRIPIRLCDTIKAKPPKGAGGEYSIV